MNNPVEDFIAKRREDKFNAEKKKIDKIGDPDEYELAMAKLTAKIDQQYDMQTWVLDAASRAKQLSIMSHPPKFSHPDAKQTTKFVADCKPDNDGLLRSGNTEVISDVYGNAAALDVFAFLMVKLGDGRTILKHLPKRSPELRKVLSILPDEKFRICCEGLMEIIKDSEPATHSWLKQVYFPVGDDYHLLSLLTSSGAVFDMKRRIREQRFGDEAKASRECRKKDLPHTYGHDDYPMLVEVGFGGANAQNVSLQNKRHGGTLYLLPSLPPELKAKARLPRRDYFYSLRWSNFEGEFKALHRLFSADWNNVNIRQARDRLFDLIFDAICAGTWQCRAEEPGWSSDRQLPMPQRIWLDDAFETERSQEDDWIVPVAEGIARWIVYGYQKVNGKQAIAMGDTELGHIRSRLLVDQEVYR